MNKKNLPIFTENELTQEELINELQKKREKKEALKSKEKRERAANRMRKTVAVLLTTLFTALPGVATYNLIGKKNTEVSQKKLEKELEEKLNKLKKYKSLDKANPKELAEALTLIVEKLKQGIITATKNTKNYLKSLKIIKEIEKRINKNLEELTLMFKLLMAAIATLITILLKIHERTYHLLNSHLPTGLKSRCRKLEEEIEDLEKKVENLFSRISNTRSDNQSKDQENWRMELIKLSRTIENLFNEISKIEKESPELSKELIPLSESIGNEMGIMHGLKGLLEKLKTPKANKIQSNSKGQISPRENPNPINKETPKVNTESNAGIGMDFDDL